MPQVTEWWSDYVRGAFPGLPAFVASVQRERTRRDAESTFLDRFTGVYVDPGDYFSPPSTLRMPSLLTASSSLLLHQVADWSGVDLRLRWFAASLCEVARRQGVPLYVARALDLERGGAWCRGAAVCVTHVRYAWLLSQDDRRWLRSLGGVLASRLDLVVTWSDGPDGPSWSLPDALERPVVVPGEPLRFTPRGILARGVKGDRVMS